MTPDRRRGTVFGALAVISVTILGLMGLVVVPPDAVQGDAQRLMYVHVPAAWVAYLAYGVTSLSSVLYLWRRTRRPAWDLLAAASAELGVLFTVLTLLLGSLWGRPIWGVWWAWDARVVTTAVLLFLYLGYLALRRVPGDPPSRAKRSAIVALVAFTDVPVVHFSVTWWRTLHQEGTVFNPQLEPQIGGIMAWTLLWGLFTGTVVYLYLLERRYRLAVLEDQLEESRVEVAIAERRAEGAWAAGIR